MQFKLPELGEGVHEGELLKWKVKVGDQVKYDQPLCEIMTDKATVEIPSAFEGKVAELHVKEGQIVHVFELMLSFEGVAESQSPETKNSSSSSSHDAGKEAPKEQSLEKRNEPNPAYQSPQPRSDSRASEILAAPSTRKLARELGVSLDEIRGSGPHGRIMKEDLTRTSNSFAGQKQNSLHHHFPSTGEERIPFRGMRKKIAEKMSLSKQKAAHFTYVEEADLTRLVSLRRKAKAIGAAQGVKITYLPFIMKAMVAALRKYPILSSSLDEANEELVIKRDINISLSVQTEDGLTAPVVKGVAHKSVIELAREIQDLVDRARNKRLTIDDFQGGTITLTNAGSIGGLFTTPVINYPEVAILGFNKIARKPVVRMVKTKLGRMREKVVIRDWSYFVISLDHRVVDGAIAAEFMKTFVEYIEDPNLLLIDSI